MATRSNIGLRVERGYLYIYCHWDGSPEDVGKTLLQNYSTNDKVYELIGLGDISSLGDTIQTTVAYGRDRGEERTEARYAMEREKVLEQEWAYVWEDNGWWVRSADNNWQGLRQQLGEVVYEGESGTG